MKSLDCDPVLSRALRLIPAFSFWSQNGGRNRLSQMGLPNGFQNRLRNVNLRRGDNQGHMWLPTPLVVGNHMCP